MLPVALDAMGGDRAPEEIVAGAHRAVEELGVPVALVGQPEVLEPLAGDLEVIPASEVIGMDEKPAVRSTWVDVVNLAARASAAAAFLTTAADHAGVKLDDATRLGMVASIPDDLDRRAVWDALDGKHGRAGRWGTLLRLGATLTAPGTVDGIIGYRRPKPLERRYLRVEHGLRPVDYDPETNTPADALPASGGPWS